MFRLFFLIALFFSAVFGVSAWGGGMTSMPTYPIEDGNTVYTEDGTHSGKISCETNGCTFIFDGIKKATYEYLDYPVISENDFYVIGTDREWKKYLLKNGDLIASWEVLSILTSYYTSLWGGRFEGWYSVSNGKFSVYKTDGTLQFTVDNAWMTSSAYYVASWVLQSTIYNKNNTIASTYINDKKISWSDGWYVQTYWTYKRSKKISELLIGSSDSQGMMQLMFFNINTWKLRMLPKYDGVTQVVPIYKKNGDIQSFEYIATEWKKYIFLDINGNRVSNESFDAVNMFTAYDDIYLKTFTKWEKMYLSFSGKTYWPYDSIDTFNPSYGNQNNYTKVLRWSVFVKTQWKNAILVNGKLFFID